MGALRDVGPSSVGIRTERAAHAFTGRDDANTLAALEELFRGHHRAALASAVGVLHDRQLAEDAVQQAFVQIAVSLRSTGPGLLADNPRAIVLRNVRWAALRIAHTRHHMVLGDLSEEAGPVEGDASDLAEQRMLCTAILSDLPNHYRQALLLRHVRQESDSRAAEQLGVTVQAYRHRLRRAVEAARVVGRRAGIAAAAEAALLGLRRLRDAGARARVTARTRAFNGGTAAGRLVDFTGLRAMPLLTIGTAVALVPLSVDPPAAFARHSGAAPAIRAAAVVADHPAPALRSTGAPGTHTPTPSTPSASVALVRGLLPGRDAHSETPDDTVVTAVTPSPAYSSDHTLLALGFGNSCQCQVIFRSTDAGAHWTAEPGPAQGATHIELPPAYPADGRIFLSSPEGSGGLDYMAPRFGAPFQLLRAPAGALAVDPRFDSGTPRVIIAGPGTVWSYNVATSALDVLLGTASPADTVSVAATTGPGAAVDILDGAPAQPSTSMLTSAIGLTSTSTQPTATLRSCTATGCTVLSHPPLIGNLVASPQFATDHTLLIWSSHGLALSRDGGRTFATAALPDGATSVSSAALLTDVDGVARIWLCDDQGMQGLALLHDTASGWRPVVSPAISGGPLQAAASLGGRVVVVRAGAGLMCADEVRARATACTA